MWPVFIHGQIDRVLPQQRPPGTLIETRARVLGDVRVIQLVATVGQYPPLRIERPDEEAAELIGVVNVAPQCGRLHPSHGAEREAIDVDPASFIAADDDESERKERQ